METLVFFDPCWPVCVCCVVVCVTVGFTYMFDFPCPFPLILCYNYSKSCGVVYVFTLDSLNSFRDLSALIPNLLSTLFLNFFLGGRFA